VLSKSRLLHLLPEKKIWDKEGICMIKTHQEMDHHSLSIYRPIPNKDTGNFYSDNKQIGYILWHDGTPKLIMTETYEPLTFSEIEQVKAEYEKIKERQQKHGV
jgi:hypothetical protein